MRRLGPPETGALAQIGLHYWLGQCQPLPSDDKALQRLAKAHPSAWHQYRTRVIAALPDVLQFLAAVYSKRAPAYRIKAERMNRARGSTPTNPKGNNQYTRRKAAALADAGNVTDTLLAPVRAPVEKPARTVDGRPIPARVTRSGHAPPTLTD